MQRSCDLNVEKGIAESFSPETSLALWQKMCEVRYFEQGAVDAIKAGEINYQVYLSSGQEAAAASFSLCINKYQVFAQHRAHDIFLTFGAPPEMLRDELRGLPSGCSRGRAGSNCLQYHENGMHMYGHHGLIAENVPLGVGAALGNNKQTLCIFGDGSAEEDYVSPSLGFAATHKLPVLFVCMDNNYSILTKTEVRRSWNMNEVAKSYGLPAVDIADDPWTVLKHTRELSTQLPAFINIRVCRGYWHAGVGIDGTLEWDRFNMVKHELNELGLADKAAKIETSVCKKMEQIWAKEILLKPLEKQLEDI
ncbi:MAG TPA: hypothetical protein DCS48_14300 [Desulfovibrio sp.]|nr:hypothetical protein [Desulfovibrio sp.]